MSDRSEFVLAWTCSLLLVAFANGIGLASDPASFSDSQRQHWSFQPIAKPDVPKSDAFDSGQVSNPIDAFIINRLNVSGHRFSVPADRMRLLRRVTFDLTGLPPSPDEIDAFLQDDSPDAYEKLVDRLLSSPHFGETWGRNWLDVVRFAETAGFKEDPIRPHAFTYRDYVIQAFNRDLTFDRFVEDQIAGDELFPEDAQSWAATAYCRMWPDESNASNILLARQTSLDDLTGNVGAAFLGLSVGCAQCHDHKFDPILQTDFYQLQAFFSGIVLEDKVAVGTQNELVNYHDAEQRWRQETAGLRRELNQLERPARYKMQGERRMKFPAEVLEALDTPIEDRTTMQRQLAFWSARQMGVKEDEIPKHLDELTNARRTELQLLIDEAKLRQPVPPAEAAVMAVSELTANPPTTYRLENGSYDKPREEVVPHFPSILRRVTGQNPPAIIAENPRSSGRRSVLAMWLASSDNPLTHRVWVNRIWQGHLGRGLVSNANDFGVQAARPELLSLFDWMTSDFIQHGFYSKRLHRAIVTSATYRQGSDAIDDRNSDHELAYPSDSVPAYSYFPRQRLSSERIRDAWLMASGQLNDSMYGPGTRPELPPNFTSYEWKMSEPSQQVRRSVYIFAKRNLPYPMMSAFDFPDMHESCGCRTKTTIAPQALMLLNNRVVLQAARSMADRTRNQAKSSEEADRIRLAWLISFGRPATVDEVDGALRFLSGQHRLVAASKDISSTPSSAPVDVDDEAMADFCHALLNANEFLFIE